MKAILILLASLTVSLNASADDKMFSPTSTFMVARANLAKFVSACLKNQAACQTSNQEQALLNGVLFDIQNEGSLQFISARENPGKFASAGTHRIAMTGLHRGDPIYVNLDEIGSIDFPGAVAILAHEFGHHEGITDTDDRVLDVLGSKVREFMLANSEMSTLKDFNQPGAGVLIFNAPGEKVGGTTSTVILFDSHGAISMSDLWDPATNCPLGFKRNGGIYLSQLRNEGPFDWDPRVQTQDFGFRLQLQEICASPQENDVQFYTVRMSVEMEPDQGVAQPDWWKTRAGHVNPNTDTSYFERGIVSYERIFQVGSGLPLKVLKIENAKQELMNGDQWNLTATVESPSTMSFETCRGDFTSPSLINLGYKPRQTIDFASCQFKPLGGNRFEVQLSTKFPQSTPSRDYKLSSIEMKVAGQDYALVGVPVFPAEVHLHSNSEPPPLTVAMMALAQRQANGQGGFIDPNIDISRPHVYHVPVTNLFAFQVLINSVSPILETSSVDLDIAWTVKGESHDYSWNVPLRDSFKYGWHLPLNGGTEVKPYPGMKDKYVLSLSLRGHADNAQVGDNWMTKSELRYIYLMNESLQEDFDYLQVIVQP